MLSRQLVAALALAFVVTGFVAVSDAAEYSGVVVPRDHAFLTPAVAGRVEAVMVDEGQSVKKGDLLLRLDDAEARLDLARAMAELEVAKLQYALAAKDAPGAAGKGSADLKMAEAELQLAEKEFERAERLYRANAMSKQDYDRAEAAVSQARAKLDQLRSASVVTAASSRDRAAVAEAHVRVAEAASTKSKWRLEQCMLLAPIDGVVLSKKAEVGEFVNPLAAGGPPRLIEIADLSVLEVKFSVPASAAGQLAAGQPCEVRVAVEPQVAVQGRVARIKPQVDASKGTLAAYAQFAMKQPARILPGMQATVVVAEGGAPADKR